MRDVDILVPTCDRPAALAVTLACLLGQSCGRFRVVVSDQGMRTEAAATTEVAAVARVLEASGRPVEFHRHLPRRGLAEHRHFLLERARAPYVLFLDDDVVTEPDLLARMLGAIERERCGFIGSFVNAPGSISSSTPVDEPPSDLAVELWEGPVRPEVVVPGRPEWDRSRLHFAAYLHRLTSRRGITKEHERLYKVAWIGGCVLFDTAKLRACGGFDFWDRLPHEHCGEDVLAQLRVMAEYGGAGLAPSGAWHQEVGTTIANREVDAPLTLGL